MGIGGEVLRCLNLAVRVLQFLDAGAILGIFTYFLAILRRYNLDIPQWMKAVEGLSGAATLYALFGMVFTCCLGGVAFFAFLAVVLDICFIGSMIAIAVMTRDGTQSCSGDVDPLFGSGASDDIAPGISSGYACMLEKVLFAVAIIGSFLFLVSIVFQILYARHHKREMRFGPSPANGYTYGTKRRGLWRRNKNETAYYGHPALGVLGLGEKRSVLSGAVLSRSKSIANRNSIRIQTGHGYGGSAYTGNY